jgi:cyclophilin family peptidyl-prolyl cis-trans isomerase
MKKKITKQQHNRTTIISIAFAGIIIAALLWILVLTPIQEENTMNEENKNVATITTSKGDIVVELFPDIAPQTVANFQAYVAEGFYNNTIFHRVIDGFMIQGGGFTPDGVQKRTNNPIQLEASESNVRGTIAMARTNDPNSATSQFFINHADNLFLNPAPGNPGYAVFGKVIKGMDVVDEIAQVQRKTSPMPDWPVTDVVILGVRFGGESNV